jgi:hypothetical protein
MTLANQSVDSVGRGLILLIERCFQDEARNIEIAETSQPQHDVVDRFLLKVMLNADAAAAAETTLDAIRLAFRVRDPLGCRIHASMPVDRYRRSLI